jgi:hypothetical protein
MLPEGATDMTGSTEAQIVIPIVAFVLLAIWVCLVFWADSHPRWGNSEVPGGQTGPRSATLPDGSVIPRPRVEGQGAPRQPADQQAPVEHPSR